MCVRQPGVEGENSQLDAEGDIPPVPVFVDSPLAVNATDVFRMHPEEWNDEVRLFLTEDGSRRNPFDYEEVEYIRDVRRSKQLNHLSAAAVIIAASGMAESGRIDSTSATHGQGETEHTSVDIERQVSRVLAEQARESLVDIDDALARIDDGTYGRCAGCGAAIPVERLFAVPAARFCVTCQAQRASG